LLCGGPTRESAAGTKSRGDESVEEVVVVHRPVQGHLAGGVGEFFFLLLRERQTVLVDVDVGVGGVLGVARTDLQRKPRPQFETKLAEDGRNSVRQVRRDANDRLKKMLKDALVSEDDEKRGLDEVQKITDNHIHQIDDLQKKKDAELLSR